jgi:hypothetical protein
VLLQIQTGTNSEGRAGRVATDGDRGGGVYRRAGVVVTTDAGAESESVDNPMMNLPKQPARTKKQPWRLEYSEHHYVCMAGTFLFCVWLHTHLIRGWHLRLRTPVANSFMLFWTYSVEVVALLIPASLMISVATPVAMITQVALQVLKGCVITSVDWNATKSKPIYYTSDILIHLHFGPLFLLTPHTRVLLCYCFVASCRIFLS